MTGIALAEWQGSLSADVGGVANSTDLQSFNTAQAGDLIVATFLWQRGAWELGPEQWAPQLADLVLPAGWVPLHFDTYDRGSDPIRVDGVILVAATIVGQNPPPYWLLGRSQAPGAGRPGHAVVNAWLWRDRHGVSDLQVGWTWGTQHPFPGVVLPDSGGELMRDYVVIPETDWWQTAVVDADQGATLTSAPPLWGTSTYQRKQTYSSPLYTYGATVGSERKSVRMMLLSVGVSTTSGPLRPLLQQPADGAQPDLDRDGLVVQWLHRPGLTAAPQTGWVLEVVTGGVTRYWDHASGTLSATQVVNPGAAATTTVAGLHNGQTVTVRVATTTGSGTQLSAWSTAATVTGVPAPTATIIVLGADAAGNVPDMTPSAMITGTPGISSASITGWQAEVWDATGVNRLASASGAPGAMFDPFPATAALRDGDVVVFRARVQQSGGGWSSWTEQRVTVDVATPDAPTVVASGVQHETSGAPGIALAITFPWATDDYPWVSRSTQVSIERRVLDSDPWTVVDTLTLDYGEAELTWRDWTAPTGRPVAYRVRGLYRAPDGGLVLGEWSAEAHGIQSPDSGWILDPSDPAGAVRLWRSEESPVVHGLAVSVQHALGRPEPLVQTGDAHLATGGTTLQTWTLDEIDQAARLLRSGALLFMRLCHEKRRTDGAWEWPSDRWFRVTSDVTEDRPVQGPYAYRKLSFSWTAGVPAAPRTVG